MDQKTVPTRDPLLLAIIEVESNGDPWAVCFESDWDLFHEPEKFARMHVISLETEKLLQSTSWGLCQVLGVTARDLGFTGPLTQLVDPKINVALGSKYLNHQLRRYNTDIPSAISAYNAGTARRRSDGIFVNQDYVDLVMKALQRYQG